MKKALQFALWTVVFLGIVSAAGFLSRFPSGTVVFLDGKSVHVNGLYLRDMEVGEDAFWRLRYFFDEDWEILDGFDEGCFGFSARRDTLFTFPSRGGAYLVEVRKGRLIKKNEGYFFGLF